jgi:hypothetical protein
VRKGVSHGNNKAKARRGLGLATCGSSSNRGTWGREATGKKKVAGFIRTRRTEIWQARMRQRIGVGLVLESGLPTGDEIGLTSGPHKLASKERKEEVTEKVSENGRASSVKGRNRFR